MRYVIALIAGYVLGVIRPYRKLDRWNWKRTTFGPTRNRDWYLYALLHPYTIAKNTVKKPEPPAKPIQLNPDFFGGLD